MTEVSRDTAAARSKTTPGPKPRFTRDDLVEVGLTILAVEGPERLSLRRLASHVGITAAALYGYFGSKSDLESALVARVMPDPPDPGATPEISWHEQLRNYLLDIHDAIANNPGVAQLFIARAADDAATNRIREHLLKLLLAGGIVGDDAVAALGTLSRYVLGSVAIADSQRRTESSGGTQPSPRPGPEFPVLRAFADSYANRNSMEATRYGLDATLLGLRAMARNPTSGDSSDLDVDDA